MLPSDAAPVVTANHVSAARMSSTPGKRPRPACKPPVHRSNRGRTRDEIQQWVTLVTDGLGNDRAHHHTRGCDCCGKPSSEHVVKLDRSQSNGKPTRLRGLRAVVSGFCPATFEVLRPVSKWPLLS